MSLIAWIDYDEKQRQRMNDLIKLFDKTDARDELGLGVIRDSIADLFFPGTTTIQTRIRYMLFVSWIYKRLEKKKILPDDFKHKADSEERSLIEPLKKTAPDEWGLFGKMKGDVQRLPSSVYWSGLQQWGLRYFDGSQVDYYQSLKDFYDQSDRVYIKSDDADRIENTKLANWHAGLPEPPNDFPKNISFDLEKDEAEYLMERIKTCQPESLLAAMLNWPEQLEVGDVWDYPRRSKFSGEQQNWIEHARLFSKVMHGAALLYNYFIAELLKEEGSDKAKGWLKKYKEMVSEWREGILAEYTKILKWDIVEFWDIVNMKAGGDYSFAKVFVTAWLDIVRTKSNLQDIFTGQTAKKLIRQRESYLKGRYARLSAIDARIRWNGDSGSGVGSYNYRWPIAQGYLNEIFAGLERK